MDYKVLIIAAVLLIVIIVIVCIFIIRLKENSGNRPQDVDTEVSWELKIPNVIQAGFKIKNECKCKENNMYNLNFDDNRKRIEKNITKLEAPSYEEIDFSSEEFFINFLKNIEEKKNGEDKINY